MYVRTYVEIEIDARKNENRFFIGRAKYPFDIFGACNIGKYTSRESVAVVIVD